MTHPVRVLYLAATPSDEAPLRVDHELREIHDAIDRGRERYALDVVARMATRATDVQRLLMLDAPGVVHFAGHGRGGRSLVMDDRDLFASSLLSVFAHHRDTVRVVVLNACNTFAVAEALSPVLDYVIGTTGIVPDGAAATFSRAFYGALAFGKTVPDAFAMAVTEVGIEQYVEARCYRLLTRPGVVPAPLHEPRDAAAPPAAPAPGDAPSALKQHSIRMGDVRSSGTANFDNRAEGSGRNQEIVTGNMDVGDLNFFN